MAERQFVVFKMCSEEYGIDIRNVQEIVLRQDITKIPQSSQLIEGVIQLRGKIVPVVDLKKRFYRINEEGGENSRVIIVDIGEQFVGVIADEVSEILSIDEGLIEPPPNLMSTFSRTGISGIGKTENRLVIFIDLKIVFSTEEREQLDVEVNSIQ